MAPNIEGILARTGLTAAHARGTDNNADAVLQQIGVIEASTGLTLDGIVMHPTDWQTVLLAKDANGQYFGGGPFDGTPSAPRLWGRPVAVSNVIAAGTALVGAFSTAAQLFMKGGCVSKRRTHTRTSS